MKASLLKIEEVNEDDIASSSVGNSVRKQIHVFQSSIQEEEPKFNRITTFQEEDSNSLDSVTSSEHSEESEVDPETEKHLVFLANKNIRQTLMMLDNKKSNINSKKRRATILFDAFERKSVLANRRATVHAKAIDRIFNKRTKSFGYDELVLKMNRFTLLLLLLIILNLILAVLDLETFVAEILSLVEANEDFALRETVTLLKERPVSASETAMRATNALLSFAQTLVVSQYYVCILKINKIEMNHSTYDNIYSTSLWKSYYVELLLLIITPSPYSDLLFTYDTPFSTALYSLNAIINLAAFLKLYVGFRVFKLNSKWYEKVSRNICANSDVTFNWVFVMKAEFNKRVLTFILLSIAVLLILSYQMRILSFLYFTHKTDIFLVLKESSSFVNHFYLTANSFARVGTGDLYPRGVFSKALCCVVALLGLFFFSYLTAILNLKLKFTPEEKQAYKTLKRLDALEKVEHKAAMVILSVISFSKNKLANQENKEGSRFCSLFVNLALLKRNISDYLKAKSDSKHIELPIEQNIIQLEKQVQEGLSKLQGNIMLLDTFTVKYKEDYKDIFTLYTKLKDSIYYGNKLGKAIDRHF